MLNMIIVILRKITQKYPILKSVLYPAIAVRRIFIKKHNIQIVQKQMVNNLCELLDCELIIKVNEFNGSFLINPHSDIFYRIISTKSYEPELVKLCLQYIDKNRDMIDVGANVGFYTVLFSQNIGESNKVLSIEPTKNGIKFLRHNIELNNVEKKVEIFEGAASNINGSTVIEIIEGKEEYSSLGNIKYSGLENEKHIKEEVECITLDTLVKEKNLNPGFIKIDVEGCEHLVIQGAHRTLLANRPIILAEICELYLNKGGSSAKELIELIRSFKYDVYDVQNPSIRFGKSTKSFPVASNIICFPKEMKTKL